MNGLRNRVRGLRSLSTAAMAVALAGGAMTIAAVTAVTDAAPISVDTPADLETARAHARAAAGGAP